MANTSNGFRSLTLSAELLCEALHLPAGTTVVGVDVEQLFDKGLLQFLISHPDFSQTESDEPIPEARALFSQDDRTLITVWQFAATK